MSDAPIVFKFKKDKFRNARGGSSIFLNIYCIHCKTWVLLYQKDGPGNLFRMYLDRIFAPSDLAALSSNAGSMKDVPSLCCSNCNTRLATPMVYEKENRLALRINPGSVVKKRSNGKLPAPSIVDITDDPEEEDDNPTT